MKIKILTYEQAKEEEFIVEARHFSNTPYCYGIFEDWPYWGQIVEVDGYIDDMKTCQVGFYYIPYWMYEELQEGN